MASFAFDLYSTIGIMVLAEFADKTNLLALSLMGKTKKPYTVAFGGLLGIAFVTLIGVVLGNVIGSIIPLDLVPIFAGIIFLWIGFAELAEKEQKEIDEVVISDSNDLRKYSVVKKSFIFIGLAEFGDKSQLFVIGRAVDGNPIAIFLGAVIGMGIIMLLTAMFGEKLIDKFPEETIHKIASIGFIVVGLLLIVSGTFNLIT